MTKTVLHIDASARTEGSAPRELPAKMVERLGANTVLRRDLAAEALPQIDETWIGANFTPADDRDAAQADRLIQSDVLIYELKAADAVVIGVPLYNFSVPAALKAWIDLVARAGVTFRYTEHGPKGLLQGKRAILAVASGGVPIGSEVDFAANYMKHVLGFIAITEVEIVAADRMAVDPEAALKAANDAVLKIAA